MKIRIITYHFLSILNRVIPQNFVSAQYHENELVNFDQILHVFDNNNNNKVF